MSAKGQKRTLQCILVMSALPPKADIPESAWHVRFVPRHSALILFDQFVGAAEQRHWNSEAERLGGLKVDDQLEFGRSLNRQIGRLVAFLECARYRRPLGERRPECHFRN